MEATLCLATWAYRGRTLTSSTKADSAAVAMPLSQYPLPPVSDLRLTVLFEANDATGYFPVHEHGFRGHGLVVKDPLPVHHECVPARGWEGGHPVRLRGQLVLKEYGEVPLRHVAHVTSPA